MSFSARCVRGAVRALNAGGRTLRRIGADPPSLDVDSLLEAARRRAGMSDLGVWPIAEPLERLLASYRDEAELTTLGRITVRELLVSLLENLLLLEGERAAHPDVESARVADPVFIVGLPRTGTTHLHGLMSRDPKNRAPSTWEVMYPATRGATPEAIARIRARTQTRLDWANRLAPEFMRIHPIAPDLPQECIAIHAQVFMGIQFHTTHDVRSYEDWFERDSQNLAYDFHRRLLQHLQTQRPGDRWVLKAPGHLFSLAALLRRYPNAKIVQTHRDPLRVMGSMASHATVLRRAFSDGTNPHQIAADWAERWARALDDFLSVRDGAPPAQFLDLHYDSIEDDPLAAIERVYDFLGWSLTDAARAAMTAFLAANPKNKHGAHRYTLEQFGLDRAALARRFGRYCERFKLRAGK
jgi:hypothetical protein